MTTLTTVDEFMESPLTVWVQKFNTTDIPLDFEDICDGIFLNDVMSQIDPSQSIKEVHRTSKDFNACIQNWEILMRNIRTFYQESLQQLIVMKLPNIVTIAREPDKESTVNELQKVLLLLLGCAVQCEKKENFINVIKELDISIQQDIVEYIKEITDSSSCVFAEDVDLNDLDQTGQLMHSHLRRLASERDEYADLLGELSQEREFYKQAIEKRNHFITPPPGLEKYHLANELVHCKNQIKDLEEELEERNKQLTDTKDRQRDADAKIVKYRSENCRLNEELRGIRVDKEDLEVLREQASMVDKYEKDVFSLKQKVVELDFYKARVEELREDNNCLIESRTKLEEMLEKSQKRESQVIDDLVKCQIQLDDLSSDKDKDKKKIESLIEENKRLAYEKKQITQQAKAERERGRKELEKANRVCSFSEELMNQTMSERVLELEMETEKLKRDLEQEIERATREMKWKDKEVAREKQALQRNIEKLQEDLEMEKKKVEHVEDKHQDAHLQTERLEEEIDVLKDSHEHHVEGMREEILTLKTQVEELRIRNQKNSLERLNLIEKENLQMFRSVSDLTSQMTRLKYTNRVLRKSCDKLKDDVDRSCYFGNENDKLRKENYGLKRAQASSRLAIEMSAELDKKNLGLQIENKKLKKLVDILKTTLTQVDPLNRITYHYITSL